MYIIVMHYYYDIFYWDIARKHTLLIHIMYVYTQIGGDKNWYFFVVVVGSRSIIEIFLAYKKNDL